MINNQMIFSKNEYTRGEPYIYFSYRNFFNKGYTRDQWALTHPFEKENHIGVVLNSWNFIYNGTTINPDFKSSYFFSNEELKKAIEMLLNGIENHFAEDSDAILDEQTVIAIAEHCGILVKD